MASIRGRTLVRSASGGVVQRLQDLKFDRSRLCPGAQEQTIVQVEEELNLILPECDREFLRFADGGFVGNFIFYSAGDGIDPRERLTPAISRNGSDCPVLSIGRDAADDFGFLKAADGTLSAEIYFLSHETWETVRAAPNLFTFLQRITSLKPGEALRIDVPGTSF